MVTGFCVMYPMSNSAPAGSSTTSVTVQSTPATVMVDPLAGLSNFEASTRTRPIRVPCSPATDNAASAVTESATPCAVRPAYTTATTDSGTYALILANAVLALACRLMLFAAPMDLHRGGKTLFVSRSNAGLQSSTIRPWKWPCSYPEAYPATARTCAMPTSQRLRAEPARWMQA